MEIIYDKLVRDKIPEIIRKDGETPFTRILAPEEYWFYLLEKDTEELEEVRSATSSNEVKKELADKLELLCAMAEVHGYTLDDIIDEMLIKRSKNGGFRDRILLEKVVK